MAHGARTTPITAPHPAPTNALRLGMRTPVAQIASRSAAGISRPFGLADDRWSRLALGGVVFALFLERLERAEGAGSYPLLPFPDMFFDIALAAFVLLCLLRLLRGDLQPQPVGVKDIAVCVFVAILATLSVLAVVTQPFRIADGLQTAKTIAHLMLLAGAALLLGRTLSARLVAFALKVFFVLAAAAAGVAVLQALDQNLLHAGLADALHLISRPDSRVERPASIFSEPAYLGYVSVAGIVAGLAVTRDLGARWALGGIVVCVLGLVLSGAAGPLAISVPFALYLLVLHRPALTRELAAGLALVAVLLAALILLTPLGTVGYERARSIAAGDDASVQLRRELDKGSVRLWKLAPATGVGLGNSRKNLTRFVHVSYLPGGHFYFNSASAYFNLFGECGPVGLAALLALLIALYLRNTDASSALERATRGIVVLFALEFLVVGILLLPPFWFWAGLRLALQRDPH